MTDKLPTHCSKPMRRSETKKGNPWWCSECGEYVARDAVRAEELRDKSALDFVAERVAAFGKVLAPGSGQLKILDTNCTNPSIDGSKVIAYDIRYNDRWDGFQFVRCHPCSTGTFKTADGREFSGVRPDPGSEWILEEVAARPLRK